MKIDVFAICYNEEFMLPYFIRHYKQFASNITVYDNLSTDKSVELMEEAGIKVIPYDTGGKLDESTYLNIKNNAWKDSKADWVIVCDIDEFIYHPQIIKILSEVRATYITPEGYEMISEDLPTKNFHIYDELKFGIPSKPYSKPCIFKPNDIIETNLIVGAHIARPTGNIISMKDSGIKLLHYKYINREVIFKRYSIYAKRQTGEAKHEGWGDYSTQSQTNLNNKFDGWLAIAKNIIDSKI